MAVHSQKHKLLFVMVPGTACSILGNYLIEHFEAEHLPKHDIVLKGKILIDKKHNTLPELLKHAILTEEKLNEYLTFATVRNPYDRLATYYQRFVGGWMESYFEWTEREYDRLKQKLSEDELNEWRRWQNKMIKRKKRRIKLAKSIGFNTWFCVTLIKWKASALLKNKDFFNYIFPMLDNVQYVIRYESLEEGLNEVLRLNHIDHEVTLPVANKTPGKKHYTEYYNWFAQKVGKLLMNKSLKRIGYSFHGPKNSRSLNRLRVLSTS